MAVTYTLGQVVRLKGTIRDVTGALVNPTTVTARVRDPAGVTTAITATNESLGVYYVEVTANSSGVWYYRFVSTGTVTAGESSFTVAETTVP